MIKKKKKIPLKKIQRLLWDECKRLIRKTYLPNCYCCEKSIQGNNDHCAHLIPKQNCGAYLRYDIRNLRRCCRHCNMNLGGNGAIFYRKMLQEEGQEYVDKLFEDKNKLIESSEIYNFYLKLLEEYKNM